MVIPLVIDTAKASIASPKAMNVIVIKSMGQYKPWVAWGRSQDFLALTGAG